jgi:hypothetical protein
MLSKVKNVFISRGTVLLNVRKFQYHCRKTALTGYLWQFEKLLIAVPREVIVL